MSKWITLMLAIGSIWLAKADAVKAQAYEAAPPLSPDSDSGLSKSLSDRPILGTQPVLRFNGEYVNSPLEDYEMFGTWSTPLSLDQPNGLVTTLSFGEGRKPGQWQLAYKQRVMTFDNGWRTTSEVNPDVTAAERSSQVLKASYRIRERWQVGASAVFEQRPETDPAIDPFGVGGGEAIGFQLDTTVTF